MQLAQVQMLGWRHIQRLGHRHAFAVMQQGDGQVVGHALLVVGEQHVATGGQIGLFHQLLQVFHGLAAEGGEVLTAFHVLRQPAAERIGAGFAVKEAPGLALLGVVAFVEVRQQVLHGLRFAQLRIAGVENGRCAVRFFLDQVDDAVTDGHGELVG